MHNVLFSICDRRNKLKFLVGAAISVILYANESYAKPTLLKLQTANGSTIDTQGGKTYTLNIDLRRDFTWTFTLANANIPILGADFLAVHPRRQTSRLLEPLHTTAISVATCHGQEYVDILYFIVEIQCRHKALKFWGDGKGAVLHCLCVLRGPS